VLSTIKIPYKIPKTKTNYKVQYFRVSTLTVSVLYCWVISVLFYTQNMKQTLKIFWQPKITLHNCICLRNILK